MADENSKKSGILKLNEENYGYWSKMLKLNPASCWNFWCFSGLRGSVGCKLLPFMVICISHHVYLV
jgi:hypothetical protein